MQSSNIPSKIPLPFAYAAGAGYVNPIPEASQIGITDGRASLHDGFPPDTFLPIGSGGVPPFGSDVNGILNEITAIQQWQEAGGMFPYDSAFSTAVGGYPKGAILLSTSFNGLWQSTVENNTSNPDANGAGWISLAFEGLQPVTITSADVTLTQIQSAYPVIVASGTKTANRSLIFPNQVGEWIVQNNTTGAFTLTAKTAAGTGVTLTQGQSTFIYGDGTNIYFANSAQVSSFNGRVGTVTLNALDVTTALGYTPVQPNGTGATGTWGINISGNAAYATNANTAAYATNANFANRANGLWAYPYGVGGNELFWGWTGTYLTMQVDATNYSRSIPMYAFGIDNGNGYGPGIFQHGAQNVYSLSRSNGGYIEFICDIGAVGCNYFTSDETKKDNIASSSVKALPILNSIETIEFDWKENSGQEGHVDLGLSAQQLQKINPAFVAELSDGTLMIKEPVVIPYLIKSIQEQQAQINTLTEQVKALLAK